MPFSTTFFGAVPDGSVPNWELLELFSELHVVLCDTGAVFETKNSWPVGIVLVGSLGSTSAGTSQVTCGMKAQCGCFSSTRSGHVLSLGSTWKYVFAGG